MAASRRNLELKLRLLELEKEKALTLQRPTLTVLEEMQAGQIIPPQELAQPIVPPTGVTPSQVIEPAITIGTGMIAEPVAGLAGLAKAPFGSHEAKEAVERTREAMTYQPRTEAGRKGLRAVGRFVEPAIAPLQRAEKRLGEAGSKISPAVGALAKTLPTAALMAAGPLISRVGKGIERGAKRSERIAKREYIKDLVSPEKTKKVLIEETARTKEVGRGPFRKSKVESSPKEIQMAFEVKRVPGISKHKTIQGNLIEVRSHNLKLAKGLDSKIAKTNVQVPHVVSRFDIDDAISTAIKDNPSIPINQAGRNTTMDRFVAQAKQIIADNPQTAKGLLDARKQFDQFAKTQRANVFQTELEPVMKVATFTIRDAMNNRIARAIPRFKADLRRQSALFGAADNIAPKAAAEANSAIQRIWQHSSDVFGTRNKVMQGLAIMAGTSVLGAATAFAPVISMSIAGVGGTVLAGKALTLPQTRRILGQLIKLSGQALGKAKDKRVISQIKADRAALIETLKAAKEQE